MKMINKLIATIACATIFTSCTKTIIIDLKDVDKKLVVDAEIGNHAKQCVVKLSKSISYANNNVFPGLATATVSISDNAGNTYLLAHDTNGVYKNDTVIGIPGAIYNLKIVSEGKTYTSSCKMPKAIIIDSIDNEEQVFFGEKVKIVNVNFTDDGTVENNYRYFKSVNGTRKGESQIDNDLFQNGIATAIRFASRGPGDDDSTSFKTGNVFGATLQNVDKAVYLYFNSKAQNTNGQSGAPANPETNIIGGALGFFSAYTSDYKETIMK
jgi:hypothetical protein